MKGGRMYGKRWIIVVVSVLMGVCATSIQAQELNKVFLKSGRVVKGKIIEKQENGDILFETTDGVRLTIEVGDIAQVETLDRSSKGAIGAGLGVPYGILGANAEYEVGKNLYISGGIGTTILAGTGYSIGLRYYLKEAGNSWRPRLSAFYGTNSVLDVVAFGGDDFQEQYSGLALGIGQKWLLGERHRQGIDLDLMFLATRGDFDDDADMLEEMGYEVDDIGAGKIKFSVGYRYNF